MRKVYLFTCFIGIFGVALLLNASIGGAESMGFYLASAAGTSYGSMHTNINYSSMVGTDALNKTRYQLENHGIGGEVMTIQAVETAAPNSPDIVASQTTQVMPLANSYHTYFDVEEKAGTGLIQANAGDDQVSKYQAAVGVGMGVTQGLLNSETWTDNGAAGQIVGPSYGVGILESGAAAEYSLYQGEEGSVGSLDDPLHQQICPWSGPGAGNVYELSTQRVDYGITQIGNWTYSATKVLYPPTPE